ncbi:uncharacterized protein LOC119684071 [Teleopsis dalmanni]|uniref:uncharacterized protein LOC119684071 n=1 Tax=Teleopsis dalmanni TaxID=139649 RepID=UPI0018CEC93D|nr:uncharacterized protein LOC119684071 [Teleopsis dalmanni]
MGAGDVFSFDQLKLSAQGLKKCLNEVNSRMDKVIEDLKDLKNDDEDLKKQEVIDPKVSCMETQGYRVSSKYFNISKLSTTDIQVKLSASKMSITRVSSESINILDNSKNQISQDDLRTLSIVNTSVSTYDLHYAPLQHFGRNITYGFIDRPPTFSEAVAYVELQTIGRRFDDTYREFAANKLREYFNLRRRLPYAMAIVRLKRALEYHMTVKHNEVHYTESIEQSVPDKNTLQRIFTCAGQAIYNVYTMFVEVLNFLTYGIFSK